MLHMPYVTKGCTCNFLHAYALLLCTNMYVGTPSSLYLTWYQGNQTGLSIVLRTPMSFRKSGIALVFYQLVISPRSFDTNESVHKSINQSNRIFFIKSKIWQLSQGVVHKLRWQDFDFFWPPKLLRWHFIWYERWQKVDIFWPPTSDEPELDFSSSSRAEPSWALLFSSWNRAGFFFVI